MEQANILKESPAYFGRMEQLYNNWLDRLDEIEYSELSTGEAVDFILLRRNVRRDLREVRQARSSYDEILPIVQFADIIQDLQAKRRPRHVWKQLFYESSLELLY